MKNKTAKLYAWQLAHLCLVSKIFKNSLPQTMMLVVLSNVVLNAMYLFECQVLRGRKVPALFQQRSSPIKQHSN